MVVTLAVVAVLLGLLAVAAVAVSERRRRAAEVAAEQRMDALWELQQPGPALELEQCEVAEPAWLASVVSRRLRVHLVDGHSVDGLLDREAADGVVLVAATYVGTSKADLGGVVWLPRDRVAMVQYLPPAE